MQPVVACGYEKTRRFEIPLRSCTVDRELHSFNRIMTCKTKANGVIITALAEDIILSSKVVSLVGYSYTRLIILEV